MADPTSQAGAAGPSPNYEQELENLRSQLRGLARERDGLRQQVNQAQQATQATATSSWRNAHPFNGLLDNPQDVDEYYKGLWQAEMSQKGYVTLQQAQQMAKEAALWGYQTSRGDAQVWRHYDRLTANEKYKDLSNPESELYKRAAKLAQELKVGGPMTEGAKTFDEWRWNRLEDMRYVADIASTELAKEAAAAEASKATAQSAQSSAQLASSPQASGAASPAGRPELSSLSSVDEVLNTIPDSKG